MNFISFPYIEQSAIIPYRFYREQLEILLITSRRGKRWIIPKGIVEPDLTPVVSAEKEALEEAGIRGQVSDALLGVYAYEKWGRLCRVEVFAMEVEVLLIDWLEASFRRRQWFTLADAIANINEPDLRKILDSLPQHLHAETF